jgi:hypothetical protein
MEMHCPVVMINKASMFLEILKPTARKKSGQAFNAMPF